eukprot:3100226-Ditylum_brightwellii.AAC.1
MMRKVLIALYKCKQQHLGALYKYDATELRSAYTNYSSSVCNVHNEQCANDATKVQLKALMVLYKFRQHQRHVSA